MLSSKKIKILHSSTRTASLDTKDRPVDASGYKEANFFLRVSASSGTNETMDIDIVTKAPYATQWEIITSFTQATGATTEMKTVAANLGCDIAADIVHGGDTPSFTFSLEAILKE